MCIGRAHACLWQCVLVKGSDNKLLVLPCTFVRKGTIIFAHSSFGETSHVRHAFDCTPILVANIFFRA